MQEFVYQEHDRIDNIRIVTGNRHGFLGNQPVWDHTKGPFNAQMFTERYRRGLVQDPSRKDFSILMFFSAHVAGARILLILLSQWLTF